MKKQQEPLQMNEDEVVVNQLEMKPNHTTQRKDNDQMDNIDIAANFKADFATNGNRTEVIKDFLEENARPELAALYHAGMEVQANTSEKAIRTPFDAKTDPHYEDYAVGFNFIEAVEAVGLTGWNWKEGRSDFFIYDFDSIVGHDEGLEKNV